MERIRLMDEQRRIEQAQCDFLKPDYVVLEEEGGPSSAAPSAGSAKSLRSASTCKAFSTKSVFFY